VKRGDIVRRGRASRAALFASVTAVGIACGARTDLGGERESPVVDAAIDCHPPMTVYGGPFLEAGCKPNVVVDAGQNEDTGIAPPYGLPPDE
jgi:hypothetical protein